MKSSHTPWPPTFPIPSYYLPTFRRPLQRNLALAREMHHTKTATRQNRSLPTGSPWRRWKIQCCQTAHPIPCSLARPERGKKHHEWWGDKNVPQFFLEFKWKLLLGWQIHSNYCMSFSYFTNILGFLSSSPFNLPQQTPRKIRMTESFPSFHAPDFQTPETLSQMHQNVYTPEI